MKTKLENLLSDIKSFRIVSDSKIYQCICDIIINRDDLWYILDDKIIMNDTINEVIYNKDWSEIKFIIGQIDYIDNDIYYIDAYGHIRNINNHDWEIMIEEIIDNL